MTDEQTVKNKEFLTRRPLKNPLLFEIYFENGGEVPKFLSGLYTSETEAMEAVKIYLKDKKRK